MPSNPQHITVRCFQCHREETWQVNQGEILQREIAQEGGARQPAGHPTLESWEILKRIRMEKIWRVVEPCPSCAMPFAAKQARLVAMDWPLTLPDCTVYVGPDKNMGPDGPMSDEEVDRRIKDAYAEKFKVRSLVSPTGWFQAGILLIFVAIFLTWLFGVICLSQFYISIYEQGIPEIAH